MSYDLLLTIYVIVSTSLLGWTAVLWTPRGVLNLFGKGASVLTALTGCAVIGKMFL